MTQHFRGVIWPRPPMEGPAGTVYRYPIVGMIVSSEPIEGFEGNEVAIDGDCDIAGTLIGQAKHTHLRHRAGTADIVLTSLHTLFHQPGAKISFWRCTECYAESPTKTSTGDCAVCEKKMEPVYDDD